MLFLLFFFFFFNDTATTEIYTLSLHDALPILPWPAHSFFLSLPRPLQVFKPRQMRSEEHTSELQSLTNLVCRLLLEKKKQKKQSHKQNHTDQYNHNYKQHEHTSTEI